MPQSLSILMAQTNPTVGAISANASKIIHIIQEHQMKHDLIVFPELALTGYPPEDLLYREELFHQVEAELQRIRTETHQCHVIVGHPCIENGLPYNSASVFWNSTRVAFYHKQHLPNYGVFDEQRYFTKGEDKPCLLTIKNHQLGLCICEDIWQPGPVDRLIALKADAVICINASPFDQDKYAIRESVLRAYAKQGVAIIYVNQVGGQDELVFDGQSMALDHTGLVSARSPAFIEHLHPLTMQGKAIRSDITPLLTKHAEIYQALMCGLKDYVEKNGFNGVLLGLSGGIDSALVLALAVDALGASRVHAVMMPSRYTACMSEEDAALIARNLQVDYTTLSIEPTFKTLLKTLAPSFIGLTPDTTEENLQARIRGVLLMALSNKTGHMLLSTSNKSETAVGYTTLYGDMAGGFAPLKDVLKTTVYDLVRYRNTPQAIIPLRVLTRPPTAELANNQTDQDNLPDYVILDAIIKRYMEDGLSAEAIINMGYNANDVIRVIKLIKRNEYKRRQAPPGVKISECAFGRDRRYPITSGFCDTPAPVDF